MKKSVLAGLAMLMTAAMCVAPVAAQTVDTTKAMADLAEKAKTGMALLRYTVNVGVGVREVSGQAICISDKGMFMTRAMDARFGQNMSNFKLILPGQNGKVVDANFVGLDVLTGMGFVQAYPAEKVTWSPMEFVKSSMTPGKQVFSVGLFGDVANTPYVSMAHISALLRMPTQIVYVTGGSLSVPGSPVLNADGKAIGIVGQQVPLSFATLSTDQGSAQLPVGNRLETSFFIPTDEFAHVMTNIPTSVTRLPWIGVDRFEPSTQAAKTLAGIDPNVASITVSGVIAEQPAAKAGLKDHDTIIAVNGKPIEKLASADLIVQTFYNNLLRLPLDSEVTLTVQRLEGPQNIKVKLEAMPKLPSEAKASISQPLGIAVRDKVGLDRYLNPASPTKDVDGLVVIDIARDGAAARAGLMPGDVVRTLNGQPMTNVDAFKTAIDTFIANVQKNAGGELKIVYQRGSQPQETKIVVQVAPQGAAPAAPAPK